MQLELTTAADFDLDEILTYSTLRFGEAVADEYYFSFDDAFARLIAHPKIGAAIETIRVGTRTLTHRQHRIFYEIDGDRIRVLRILHNRMDVSAAFDA